MKLRTKTLVIFTITLATLLAIMYVTHALGLGTGYVVLALMVSGLGFLVVFIIVLDRLVLSRFNYIGEIVRDIRTNRDATKRIHINGNDELSRLAIAINKMLMELQTSQNVLRNSEEKNRAILEALPDAICQFSADGTLVNYKPAIDNISPFPLTDPLGKNLRELLPLKWFERAEYHLQQALQTGTMQVFDYSLLHDNVWRSYEVRMVRSGEDEALTILRNITEQKKIETSLIEEKQQLQTVNNELESFAYSVSHDLRAPLRSIDGFSQLLMEECATDLDNKCKDYLSRVRAASQRMSDIIDDLLNLSRVTRGEMHYKKVDLTAVARKIANELKQSQPERHVEFSIARGLAAKGDEHLMRVALENLLKNAWKFSREQEHARISVGYERNNGSSAYFVRDNGAGFDMAYANKLFGPFQRLHTDKEFEGTGIGLATVQRIIHRHGGRIWAKGEVDQGATFYFTL